MIRRLSTPTRFIALLLALVAGASCTSDTVAGLSARRDLAAPSLLQCDPPAAPDSVVGLIGPLGGTLSIGNTSVVIPQGAVPGLTSFRLLVPASRNVEISVKAGDADHYLFLQPVLVTIDYGRCASAVSSSTVLSAWHIDESTKAFLENMNGVDVRLTHTITFTTGHLSGYAVAD